MPQVELNRTISTVVLSWVFENTDPVVTPGTLIVVDESGQVIVNDEVVEGEIVTVNGNDTYDRGDVSITIEPNENGDLVLTEFTTSNSGALAFFGSTVYLPTALSVNGVEYPIIGIDQPLSIDLGSVWFGLGSNNVYVPEGYTYICDGALASNTCKTTFHLPSTLESIGTGAFMPARNTTQTIDYASSQANWNAMQKAANWENGQGSITVNYNR